MQQAKFEVAPSSGDDSHLDAMSIMSGEPSDGVNSSLKDFDEVNFPLTAGPIVTETKLFLY